ncbi:cytochrome P450 [Amycolatopsis rhizosphaerae]|uniref:Cytochrome P450 n=1 Tax=Amycolatopsis rhizosphaerae TaxID=2053003 RepID=A0A558AUM1_9PSEU|nr:cytochrome P450 [Amycolatopsis rhizosphaerae]TVT27973.1 cytochrome P450 [Amycolatopsis rhizosphaerae]
MPAPVVATVDEVATVNLADPATHVERDLSGYWRRLRTSMPVHWHPESEFGRGFWVLSRYSDIISVYRDNERFTSEEGNVLATLLQGGDTASGKMLAVTDGRRQRDLRGVMLKAFSPRVLARLADKVNENTERRVRGAVERGEFDFAAEVSEHIPISTICDLLGVPESDRATLLRLNKSALSSDDPGETFTDAWSARNEILLYFAELAEERRREPKDDVVTVLATATVDDVRLSPQEIIFNCYSLILGGDESTRISMNCAVHAFTEFPEQWRALKRGDAGVKAAVEEVLRWSTPAMHFGRTARQDVTLYDRVIKKGDLVTLWNSSANRDEEIFADPYVFDVGRSPNKHVTFGHGPHFCLGSYLARVELEALLTALITFVDGVELAGPVGRVHSNFLSGISRLPVKTTPSRRTD